MGHQAVSYTHLDVYKRQVKFYIDGDEEYPTICGTGTEDYFGGSWSFAKQVDMISNDGVGPETVGYDALVPGRYFINGQEVVARVLRCV